MKINDRGLALVKRYEGMRLEAYRCPASVLTIVFLGILTKGEVWPICIGCAFMAGGFFERARR
jgi:GH24 family phage-related lysozyme (muramidase)